MVAVLAKSLAKDVMTREPVCVEPWMTIRQLARIFGENEISGAPVVDDQGRVIGLVSKTDLIRQCLEGTGNVLPAYLFESLAATGAEEREISPETTVRVEDFMTLDPVIAGPDASACELAKLMFDRRIHRIIVADSESKPLGMITSLDLLGVFPSDAGEARD
jgi:CBS domain-containing protein